MFYECMIEIAEAAYNFYEGNHEQPYAARVWYRTWLQYAALSCE